MVTMPAFGFDGVSSSLAEFISIFFSQLFFHLFFFVLCTQPRHHRQHRQHTNSAGCVLQPAGYNATHACRLPAEREATPYACGSLSAMCYCCCGFLFSSYFILLSDPAISRPAGLCCCVIHACMLPQVRPQHRYFTTS